MSATHHRGGRGVAVLAVTRRRRPRRRPAPDRAAPAAGDGDHALPVPEPDAPGRPQRVADLLGRMTLAEKVGQMTQAERADVAADPSLITAYALGSVLSGGGSVPDRRTRPRAGPTWSTASRQAALDTRLGIPLLYGVDSVHGHGNLQGATVFPHNIGLGATRDPRAGRADRPHHRRGDPGLRAAVGVRAVRLRGPRRPLGPHLRELRRDPALVTRAGDGHRRAPGPAAASSTDADRVLATAKHYAGDGLTTYGTGEGDYTDRPGHHRGHRAPSSTGSRSSPYPPAIERARTSAR